MMIKAIHDCQLRTNFWSSLVRELSQSKYLSNLRWAISSITIGFTFAFKCANQGLRLGPALSSGRRRFCFAKRSGMFVRGILAPIVVPFIRKRAWNRLCISQAKEVFFNLPAPIQVLLLEIMRTNQVAAVLGAFGVMENNIISN
jgi:hypothetical protein